MPFVSEAQRRYFYANRGKLESQGVDVDEWEAATGDKKLPERAPKAKKKKKAGLLPESATSTYRTAHFLTSSEPGTLLHQASKAILGQIGHPPQDSLTKVSSVLDGWDDESPDWTALAKMAVAARRKAHLLPPRLAKQAISREIVKKSQKEAKYDENMVCGDCGRQTSWAPFVDEEYLHPHCMCCGWTDRDRDGQVKTAAMSAEAEISFPSEEIPDLQARLDAQQPIYTTRVDAEKDRYSPQQLLSSVLGPLRVSDVTPGEGIASHPFQDELTGGQKAQIGDLPYSLVKLLRENPQEGEKRAVIEKQPEPSPMVPILLEKAAKRRLGGLVTKLRGGGVSSATRSKPTPRTATAPTRRAAPTSAKGVPKPGTGTPTTHRPRQPSAQQKAVAEGPKREATSGRIRDQIRAAKEWASGKAQTAGTKYRQATGAPEDAGLLSATMGHVTRTGAEPFWRGQSMWQRAKNVANTFFRPAYPFLDRPKLPAGQEPTKRVLDKTRQAAGTAARVAPPVALAASPIIGGAVGYSQVPKNVAWQVMKAERPDLIDEWRQAQWKFDKNPTPENEAAYRTAEAALDEYHNEATERVKPGFWSTMAGSYFGEKENPINEAMREYTHRMAYQGIGEGFRGEAGTALPGTEPLHAIRKWWRSTPVQVAAYPVERAIGHSMSKETEQEILDDIYKKYTPQILENPELARQSPLYDYYQQLVGSPEEAAKRMGGGTLAKRMDTRVTGLDTRRDLFDAKGNVIGSTTARDQTPAQWAGQQTLDALRRQGVSKDQALATGRKVRDTLVDPELYGTQLAQTEALAKAIHDPLSAIKEHPDIVKDIQEVTKRMGEADVGPSALAVTPESRRDLRGTELSKAMAKKRQATRILQDVVANRLSAKAEEHAEQAGTPEAEAVATLARQLGSGLGEYQRETELAEHRRTEGDRRMGQMHGDYEIGWDVPVGTPGWDVTGYAKPGEVVMGRTVQEGENVKIPMRIKRDPNMMQRVEQAAKSRLASKETQQALETLGLKARDVAKPALAELAAKQPDMPTTPTDPFAVVKQPENIVPAVAGLGGLAWAGSKMRGQEVPMLPTTEDIQAKVTGLPTESVQALTTAARTGKFDTNAKLHAAILGVRGLTEMGYDPNVATKMVWDANAEVSKRKDQLVKSVIGKALGMKPPKEKKEWSWKNFLPKMPAEFEEAPETEVAATEPEPKPEPTPTPEPEPAVGDFWSHAPLLAGGGLGLGAGGGYLLYQYLQEQKRKEEEEKAREEAEALLA